MTGRCGGCAHAAHKNACPGKAPSGCVPLSERGSTEQSGWACHRGQRPECLCSWRTCKCGAEVDEATLMMLVDDVEITVPVLRGSYGDLAGLLEVWADPAGELWCRELEPGEPVTPGRWRGVEHDGPCQQIHGPAYQEAR